MHIHAFDEEGGAMMYGKDHPNPLKNETYRGVKTPAEQIQETFKRFNKYKIVKAVVTDGELWHKKFPEIVIISGRNMPVDSMRKKFIEGELQVIGEVTSFYAGLMADDPSLAPYFDLAEELQIPLGYHVLPGGPPGGIYKYGLKDMRVRNANPLQLEEVLVKHPNIKLYVMHAGWPYLEDMKALMYAHPQVYLDLATISWILPKKEFHDYLQGLVNAGFSSRIMFGSDQMVWPETIDIAIDAVNTASFLTLKQKEDIFYNNAASFLKLSEKEIRIHKTK